MNKAMNENAGWAFLGGLLLAGRANVFVSTWGKSEQTQLWLTFFVDADIAGVIFDWLRSTGRNVKMGRGRNRNRVRFHFRDSEANKILSKTFGHIEDVVRAGSKSGLPVAQIVTRLMLLQKAQAAFDYWKTMQKRGIRLTPDLRRDRLKAMEQLATLKAKWGKAERA